MLSYLVYPEKLYISYNQQLIQNSARVLTRTRKREHIIAVLKSLHWVGFGVYFKIILLFFKALHGLTMAYMYHMLTVYEPVRLLRSSGTRLLVVPKYRTKAFAQVAYLLCLEPLKQSA